MPFLSILFKNEDNIKQQELETVEPFAFFNDLNLNQVVDYITSEKPEYNLKPFFYTPLHDIEAIRYRHEVMRDMEETTLSMQIKAFAESMNRVRKNLDLIKKLDFDYQKKAWFLEAALIYCDAVTLFTQDLKTINLTSQGLIAFREYITLYVHSNKFQSMFTEAQKVKAALSAVTYSVIIQDGKFSVRKYEEETDYSIEVEKSFEKFKQGAVKNYRLDLKDGSDLNHIEAKILSFVALLYPEQFAALEEFCTNHAPFTDDIIRTFDREIQFYVAYLELIAKIQHKGLVFCYPKISVTRHDVYNDEAFDLAFACTTLGTQMSVISNSFYLKEPERIIVVSGPNQGGKTTFARMFGQLHYLASLGCPVPGKEAQLLLYDQIFTHFVREEDISNLQGKLQNDLVRIHDILALATPNSILIVNEMFVSTTLKDAIFLSKEIMARIMKLDLFCVWVTFIDELSSLSEKTISMVSTVVPENPAMRTFKVVRQPADGLAYALSIAKKHRLTYDQIKERIKP